MRAAATGALIILFASACARTTPPAPAPAPGTTPAAAARGALEVRVEPNPVVAHPVGGSTFEFPFTISVREIGGAPVEIQRVGIDVFSVGGLKVYSSQLTAAEIESRGYPRRIEPFGEVRYRMRPRQQVPDERLFSSVWGELWAEGVDAGGRKVETRSRVSIRKAP